MIISVLLLFLTIISFVGFILSFPFRLYQYAIIPFIIFCIFLLIFKIWFNHRCRKYINLNRNIVHIEKFIQARGKNEGYIIFSSINGIYSCVGNDSIIRFDLNGFILKKSFIRAFIIRQIRYKAVSKKLKISKLFSIKLKCKCKYDKINLVINNHSYLIYLNGVSKNSFLSSEISKAKFASMYNSTRNYFTSNRVEVINEKIYLDYYKFYKNF